MKSQSSTKFLQTLVSTKRVDGNPIKVNCVGVGRKTSFFIGRSNHLFLLPISESSLGQDYSFRSGSRLLGSNSNLTKFKQEVKLQ